MNANVNNVVDFLLTQLINDGCNFCPNNAENNNIRKVNYKSIFFNFISIELLFLLNYHLKHGCLVCLVFH